MTYKNILYPFFCLLLIVFISSCEDDPTCTDGIQNGGETGIDCYVDGSGPCQHCDSVGIGSANCMDGIQNQNELGVDCGGVCTPCINTANCNDGIMNQNETGIDCGGVCTACAGTCSDGIMNQDETGVDCGGVCPACTACDNPQESPNYTLDGAYSGPYISINQIISGNLVLSISETANNATFTINFQPSEWSVGVKDLDTPGIGVIANHTTNGSGIDYTSMNSASSGTITVTEFENTADCKLISCDFAISLVEGGGGTRVLVGSLTEMVW